MNPYLTILVSTAILAAGPASAQSPTGPAERLAPPPSWQAPDPAPDSPQGPGQAGDPADSLYRAAREAVNRNDYRRAADLFRRIHERFAESAYAADALYWHAFALYRLGGSDNYRLAVEVLERQRAAHRNAATRRDAEALVVRIRGELARLGDAESARRVTEEAAQTGTACPTGDEADIRIAALNALIHMDADRAVPILKQVLARRDACAAPLRRKAVFLIAEKQTAETEGILLDLARTDPDPEVRKQAVFWLSEVETEGAVNALEEILRNSDDPSLRERALFALSEHQSPRASQILRGFAENEAHPEELRGKAIFWLGQQESRENAEFLRALFARLTSSSLKEKTLFSLSEMEGYGNDRWLLDVALSAREPMEVRKKALFWAGEAGAPITELVGLYDRTQEPELKRQLIFVYSQRDEKPAVDKLIEIARREPDLELRKKAIFWLSESDDPRVVQVLQELINQP